MENLSLESFKASEILTVESIDDQGVIEKIGFRGYGVDVCLDAMASRCHSLNNATLITYLALHGQLEAEMAKQAPSPLLTYVQDTFNSSFIVNTQIGT